MLVLSIFLQEVVVFIQRINLLLLASAVTLMASNVHAAPVTPYVGVSIGETSNFSNKTISRSFRGIPVTTTVGYIAMMSPYVYLGGEFFGVLGNVTLDNNGLKSTHSYGVSVVPAIMIADHTLAFMRVGLIWTMFKPQTIHSQWQNGYQLGMGLQFSVTPNIDLRTEYIYSAYNSFASVVNPSQDTYNFGIIYKF
jgi:opacity protein-like surface antigen